MTNPILDLIMSAALSQALGGDNCQCERCMARRGEKQKPQASDAPKADTAEVAKKRIDDALKRLGLSGPRLDPRDECNCETCTARRAAAADKAKERVTLKDVNGKTVMTTKPPRLNWKSFDTLNDDCMGWRSLPWTITVQSSNGIFCVYSSVGNNFGLPEFPSLESAKLWCEERHAEILAAGGEEAEKHKRAEALHNQRNPISAESASKIVGFTLPDGKPVVRQGRSFAYAFMDDPAKPKDNSAAVDKIARELGEQLKAKSDTKPGSVEDYQRQRVEHVGGAGTPQDNNLTNEIREIINNFSATAYRNEKEGRFIGTYTNAEFETLKQADANEAFKITVNAISEAWFTEAALKECEEAIAKVRKLADVRRKRAETEAKVLNIQGRFTMGDTVSKAIPAFFRTKFGTLVWNRNATLSLDEITVTLESPKSFQM